MYKQNEERLTLAWQAFILSDKITSESERRIPKENKLAYYLE